MEEILPPAGPGNLWDYEALRRGFDWGAFRSEFDWSRGGAYNVAAEAIDRHALDGRGPRPALHSVGVGGEVRSFTFQEMSEMSSRLASGLVRLGARRGERVLVYLDRGPELLVSLLGIVKMGGIAGPLFSALGPEAVRDRAMDCQASAIVTTPYLFQRLRTVLGELGSVRHFIILGHEGEDGIVPFERLLRSGDPGFPAVDMGPDDPYVIHYTSGSTGKPKGILLAHKAMTQQLMACRYVVDLREDDVYWCTADPGWVTGTSVGIFGPWYLGTTVVSYEGRFDARAWYSLIQRLRVSVWFTAPTALRMLMREGDALVRGHELGSLRHVCSAGEPLNPEVVRWGLRALGQRIHDNWWQTETGAPCISNFRSVPLKPGSMGLPLPGVSAAIVDERGEVHEGHEVPHLVEVPDHAVDVDHVPAGHLQQYRGVMLGQALGQVVHSRQLGYALHHEPHPPHGLGGQSGQSPLDDARLHQCLDAAVHGLRGNVQLLAQLGERHPRVLHHASANGDVRLVHATGSSLAAIIGCARPGTLDDLLPHPTEMHHAGEEHDDADDQQPEAQPPAP